jgi:hypothetical protein
MVALLGRECDGCARGAAAPSIVQDDPLDMGWRCSPASDRKIPSCVCLLRPPDEQQQLTVRIAHDDGTRAQRLLLQRLEEVDAGRLPVGKEDLGRAVDGHRSRQCCSRFRMPPKDTGSQTMFSDGGDLIQKLAAGAVSGSQ